MRDLLLLMALGTAGCATHVPPNALSAQRYEDLPWARDLEDARARALAEGKPVMLILVSGAMTGFC